MTLTTPSPAEGNAESLKDAGNEAFKNGEYQKSIDFYTEALLLNPDSRDLKATLYRNRAMVRLKLEDAEGCEQDCTRALEFNGADVKALYRRALAREKLEMIGSAITDARNALHFMPKDKGIIELLQRLVKLNTEKQKTMLGIENKVNEMSTMAFHDEKSDSEQRLTAMNNLLVLARDSESGAIHVWDNGKLVDNVFSMVYNKSVDDEMAIAIIRVLDECIKNSKRALSLVDKIGFPKITRLLIARSNVQFLDACSIILQRIFNALAKMDRTKDIKPDPEVSEANKMPIIKFLLELEDMLTDATVQYQPRETVIDLLSRNLMHMDGGLPRGWSWRFMEDRGLLKLFLLSSQIPEQCTIPVSAETRQHLAICLCRLYDDCVFDTKRAVYRERLDGFFKSVVTNVSLI
ncbi:hypothetical protein AB6A40_010634 [Gnathostoma spinigerum]|uniref:Uncharacterized protein n=1 Tax=Gnathostoma spinigerum TaxID=75299 RepID=A0ABD6F3L8_9BILA